MQHLIKYVFALIIGLTALTNNAYAHYFNIPQSRYAIDCGHWYVSANVGASHMHDKVIPNSGNSKHPWGPGWNADLGYQFNPILGSELGYTQYHDSRENAGRIAVAKTEHYALHLAVTGRYALTERINALGKLGIAYSYANKIFTVTGFSASSGSVSPYFGLGLTYIATRKVELVAQWGMARGNRYTGSTELYSLGAIFAIV